jgi:hypothetical protein
MNSGKGDDYVGNFISVGGQVGSGLISGGVSYFHDTKTSAYGVTTSLSIGSNRFSGYGLGGSLGSIYGPAPTSNEGYQQIAAYLLSGLWYGPALQHKAWANSQKQ